MRQLLFGIAMAVIVAASQGCKQNVATGRTQFNFMSMEQQIALGAEASPELVKEYGGEVKSQELRSYVNGVGRRLSKKVEGDYRDLEWTFYVLDSDVINAFALPGGRVFMSRGLMSYMSNEAELAAVLGHEIGHVTAEHGGERISQSMGISTLASATGFILGDTPTASLVNAVVGVGGQGYLLKFSRSQESEADRLGMRYMVAGGYDPTGMLQLLQILIDVSQGARQPEILSTHPDPNNRRADAEALLASEYAYTQGNRKYGLYEDRWNKNAAPHLPAARGAAVEGDFLPVASSWCLHCAAEARLAALPSRE